MFFSYLVNVSSYNILIRMIRFEFHINFAVNLLVCAWIRDVFEVQSENVFTRFISFGNSFQYYLVMFSKKSVLLHMSCNISYHFYHVVKYTLLQKYQDN